MALDALDQAKLNQLLGQMPSELGGAASAEMVRMGDGLGLYKAMNEKGPLTSADLAAAVGVNGSEERSSRLVADSRRAPALQVWARWDPRQSASQGPQ